MPAMKQVAFVEADKYILAKDYHDIAPFKPHETIRTSYGIFYDTGEYIIHKGFLFSANSPAINTLNTRRAACIHDFIYCLMKDGYLPRSFRSYADELMRDILIEDGIPAIRAHWWYAAVRLGGEAALNAPRPPVKYSPVEAKAQDPVKFGMA